MALQKVDLFWGDQWHGPFEVVYGLHVREQVHLGKPGELSATAWEHQLHACGTNADFAYDPPEGGRLVDADDLIIPSNSWNRGGGEVGSIPFRESQLQ